MREPPAGVSDTDVAAVLAAHWRVEVDRVEHLPVGFGAHHWRASGPLELFVTLDVPGPHHPGPVGPGGSLGDAYAAAAALQLPFVVACRSTEAGTYTVPLGAHGWLSCTPWLDAQVVGDGPIADEAIALATLAALDVLHATTAPARIPRWTPRVGPDLADRLSASVRTPWVGGPHGPAARTAVSGRLSKITEWTARYHELAEQARDRTWVPTHGEPHTRNQPRTSTGIRLVDWESFALAPRERDLGILIDFGWSDAVRPDLAMVELFDLEWRLDEISQYADRFAGPHGDGADDRIRLEGLRRELSR